ncbi:hypothetical protein AAFF_G00003880 [Aldrovandia affinis]|uniref:Uncharacterized protein n=1 Tax=Aldrovandia affinis TaxID=143900 RepID=A0AAD7X4Z8_9TELE|nr:hypothetical protein AAFF_G00003880 [Aldrovandia affinis]
MLFATGLPHVKVLASVCAVWACPVLDNHHARAFPLAWHLTEGFPGRAGARRVQTGVGLCGVERPEIHGRLRSFSGFLKCRTVMGGAWLVVAESEIRTSKKKKKIPGRENNSVDEGGSWVWGWGWGWGGQIEPCCSCCKKCESVLRTTILQHESNPYTSVSVLLFAFIYYRAAILIMYMNNATESDLLKNFSFWFLNVLKCKIIGHALDG